MKHIVFLGLGTNLGDRLENLASARQGLEPRIQVLAASPIYETPPWGYVDQPYFLNQALKTETELSPLELLSHLKGIEKALGRQPGLRYGPRLIDIDILFYDNLVLSQAGLEIPHPRLDQRAFVLAPLATIAGEYRHPVLGRTIQEMLEAIDSSGVVLYPGK